MSTYEFVVSSRDRRSESSDVEAGAKSPANKKRFKVSLSPSAIIVSSSSRKFGILEGVDKWQIITVKKITKHTF